MFVVPPNDFQFVTCAGCSWLVRIWSEITAPDIVNSAKIVMTVIVFMRLGSLRIVAENVRAWRIFGTKAGNYRGRRRAGSDAETLACAAQTRTNFNLFPLSERVKNYPPAATQVHCRRGPREATRPSWHIGLLMSSQKQNRTAISATLNSSRGFILKPMSFAQDAANNGVRDASRLPQWPPR